MPSTWNTDKRSYTAGHFELLIDGHPTTAYLKSIDGGFMKSSLVDEPIGPENHRIKHTSTVDIDPLSIEMGMSGANSMIKWIQSSWRKEYSQRNGQVTHADSNKNAQVEHQFYNALITETTFPALDGGSKEDVYLKLKLQPEKVVTTIKPSKTKLQGNAGAKHKQWMCSAFRLNIDGLDDMKYVNKIDSFTIKQGIKKMYTGIDRLPEINPTKIEFPAITGTIAMTYADSLFKWYDQYVVRGQSDPNAQKTGSIEFLSTDRGSVMFRINLKEVGIHGLSIMQSSAGADGIKRAKFELYVGSMDIDGPGLGME